MMRLRIALLALLICSMPAVAQIKTKAAVQAEINTNLPNQNVGAITPSIMRGLMSDVVNSYLQGATVNAQTGTSYTVQCTDMGALLTFNNSSAVAVTLPSAATTCFNSNWVASFKNNGSGAVTITPQAGAINGAATLVLISGAGAYVVSDGTNYQTWGSSSSINPWIISGANIYYIAGNVGIGTITPAAVLDVNGTIRFDNFPNGCLTTDGSGNVSAGSCAAIVVLASSRLATTTALPTNTYANGTLGVGATLTATANASLSIDSVATNTNDVVLIKNEATAANNGIYTVTQTGDGSHPYILTRATYFNSISNMTQGSFTFISAGTVNANTGWALGPPVIATVGTTAVNFNQFSNALGQLWLASGSNVYYTAGKVGVGTSSPTNDLTILESTTSAAGGLAIYRPSGTSHTSYQQLNDDNQYAFNFGAGFQWFTNGASVDAMSLAANGNLTANLVYTPTGVGAVPTLVQTELNRYGIWANDFGAVCNGSTSDSTAFQNAINEAESLGVPMRFIGVCAFGGAVNVTSGLEISGMGTPGTSEILITNTSQNGLIINTAAPVYFHDFSMNYSSLPGGVWEIILTAPSGVNSGSRFERVNLMSGGSNCIELLNSAFWTVVNSEIACQSTGVLVSDANTPDAGDSTISGSLIQSGIGGSAIVWNSSGGLRVENNKILGNNMTCGICFSLASGATTADLFVIGNSIEGVSNSGNGIKLSRLGSTGALGTVIINGNELSGNFGVLSPTDANGVWLNNMVITSNICVTCVTAGFSIDSVQGLVVANNFIQPFNASTVPVAIGTHGATSTNCVVGPNPHLGTAAPSNPGSCTAIAPN